VKVTKIFARAQLCVEKRLFSLGRTFNHPGVKDHKAIEWLSGQLPGLVESGVITPETAEALRAHYKKNDDPGHAHRLAVIVCAILGGTLVGAGIILLIAHNWEDMGRPVRTAVSFLPLVVACFVSGLAILRRPASAALSEGGGIFHVLAIGAAISLVAQTYHIAGNFSDFVLTWSLLALPLVYLLRSTAVAILYLIGITVWAGSRMNDHAGVLWYWPMFAAAMPFYGALLRESRRSIRANWLSTAIGVSVPFALGFQCEDILENTWFLLFSGFFAVLYLIERQWFRGDSTSRFVHPFRVIGAGGIMVLSIVMSYGNLWRGHSYRVPEATTFTNLVAFGLSHGFVVVTVLLSLFCWRKKTDFNVFAAAFPLAALAAYFLFLHENNMAIILVMNSYAALLAIGTIVRGFSHNRLGTLNAGMVIAAALIVARFFDSDLSFVVRGVAFIAIGTGFLAANWILLKKRREPSP
jgi:uncharacterized membrane protein